MSINANSPNLVISVTDFGRYIISKIHVIFMFGIISFIAAIAVTVNITPQYKSRSVISIELKNRDSVNVSAKIEGLRSLHGRWNPSSDYRCMFQDRNGVISIECTASSPNEALSKTKMAHEQIIMLFGNTENNNLNEYLRDVISIHDNIERSILEISPPKKHVDDKSQKVIVDDLIHNKLPQIQFNHWSLLQKIIKLENAFNKQLPPITIMEPTVDVKPIRPNYMRNYLFSIIFGIFCGILYVFIGYAYSKR